MSDDDTGNWRAETASDEQPQSGSDSPVANEQSSVMGAVGASIVGVVIGLMLLIASLGGIFWNENSSVQVARALDEGLGVVVSAPSDRVDPGHEGKLVHVTGALSSARGVRDDLLNVPAQGLRLRRVVEMMQWKESSSSRDGRTTYSYSREWSSSAIDSSRFRDAANHRNPPFPFQSQTFNATDAMLGPYRLGAAALAEFQYRSETRAAPPQTSIDGIARRLNRPAFASDEWLVVSRNAADPAVGDLRIAWRLIPEGPGSVAGRQISGEIAAYTARNGRPVLLAATGTHSAEAMFALGQADNRFFTWVIRIICLFVLFFAFLLVMGPFLFLASRIPIIGDIFAAGSIVVALVMTIVVGFGAIGIAWFAVRPLLTLSLLAAGVAAVMGAKWLNRGKAEQKHAGQPMTAGLKR